MNKEPIFIAGPDRSGTTLMFALLASHPSLSMVRRTNMWRYFHGRYGDLHEPENFEHCLEHMVRYNRMRHLEPDPARIREEFWQGEPSYGRLFALFHEHNAERMGRTRWGDKSLHTEHFAEQVFEEFPRAKIIHMVRDPRDRYASVSNRYGRTIHRVGAAMGRWLLSTRLGEQNQKRFPESYKMVRFEQLAAYPEETLRDICAFIGEPYMPVMLTMAGAAEHKEQGGNSSFGQLTPGVISTKPIGRFRTVLEDSDVAFIQKVASTEMAAFDYELEPIQLSTKEWLRAYCWDFPLSLAHMIGWIAIFKFRLRRGIHVPTSRLRDIPIPQATYPQGT